jgi:hypothetical protein
MYIWHMPFAMKRCTRLCAVAQLAYGICHCNEMLRALDAFVWRYAIATIEDVRGALDVRMAYALQQLRCTESRRTVAQVCLPGTERSSRSSVFVDTASSCLPGTERSSRTSACSSSTASLMSAWNRRSSRASVFVWAQLHHVCLNERSSRAGVFVRHSFIMSA